MPVPEKETVMLSHGSEFLHSAERWGDGILENHPADNRLTSTHIAQVRKLQWLHSFPQRLHHDQLLTQIRINTFRYVSWIIACLDAFFAVEHQAGAALERERVFSMALDEFGAVGWMRIVAVFILHTELCQFACGF